MDIEVLSDAALIAPLQENHCHRLVCKSWLRHFEQQSDRGNYAWWAKLHAALDRVESDLQRAYQSLASPEELLALHRQAIANVSEQDVRVKLNAGDGPILIWLHKNDRLPRRRQAPPRPAPVFLPRRDRAA